MKKPILFLYCIAAIVAVTVALIAVIGCNNGDGGPNAGLNDFLGGLVNRAPGGDPGDGGKYSVNVENGGSPGGNSYAAGETVVITTDGERDGLRFNGWTSSSAGVNIADPGNTQTYFIMPSNPVTVKANFTTKPKFDVVYNANGGENPPRDNGSPYDSGATVRALGEAGMSRDGYYFSGWSTEKDGGGRQIGGDETFTITGQTTLYARWTSNTVTSYEVIVINGSGGGKRTAGETVEVTAGNVDGQTFKNWTSTPAVAFANANEATTTFKMPASDVTVTANFEEQTVTPSTYTLTVKANSGGTATPASQSVTAGTQVSISATPANGYSFSNWTISGGGTIANANSASTSVTVNGNVTVTANFTKNPTATTYTLTVNRNPTNGGTTNPASSQSNITAGMSVNISATANPSYTFSNWTISGSGAIANANNASTSVTVNGNVTVTAYFKETTPDSTSCGTSCFWGNKGCGEIKIDPIGGYYISSGIEYPMINCEQANEHCDIFGGGRYGNINCDGDPVKDDPDVFCNEYCVWSHGDCYELKTDKRGVTNGDPQGGKVMNVCFDNDHPMNDSSVVNTCKLYSPPMRTFATLNECEAYVRDYPSKFPDKPLRKSRSASSLRATYSRGAVTATLTLPAAVKFSGGVAELLDDRTGAAVSTAAVSVSGRKAAAVLPVGVGVSAGYYTVRVVLRDRSGGQIVEEASIGIIK